MIWRIGSRYRSPPFFPPHFTHSRDPRRARQSSLRLRVKERFCPPICLRLLCLSLFLSLMSLTHPPFSWCAQRLTQRPRETPSKVRSKHLSDTSKKFLSTKIDFEKIFAHWRNWPIAIWWTDTCAILTKRKTTCLRHGISLFYSYLFIKFMLSHDHIKHHIFSISLWSAVPTSSPRKNS